MPLRHASLLADAELREHGVQHVLVGDHTRNLPQLVERGAEVERESVATVAPIQRLTSPTHSSTGGIEVRPVAFVDSHRTALGIRQPDVSDGKQGLTEGVELVGIDERRLGGETEV